MAINDFIHAIRHLKRRKLYTLIILLSLTIGFTCTNLLLSFIIAETNTDSFHVNRDRTFQLFSDDPFGGKGAIGFIPDYVGDYLNDRYPEVEATCRINNVDNVSLESPAGEFNNFLILASDSSFFSMLSFPLEQGSGKHVFHSGSILLTEEKARILFGQTDAIGKLVSIKTPDTTRLLTVSGVINKGQEKSHLKFDAIVHHSVLKDKVQGGATYVLLNNAFQGKSLEEKINADNQRPGMLGPGKTNYYLKPLAESYFNKDNRMPYMKTRSVLFLRVCYAVCALLFLIASFNFINLFVLSIQERKKQVGIKKTLGVSFTQLIKSTLAEIVVYVSTAFVLSLLLTSFLLTSLNGMLDASITFWYLFRPALIFIISLLVFFLGTIVVMASAWQQWKVRPISLMRTNTTSKAAINKAFFFIQFFISATLLICALTIVRQMNFLEKEPLGFNRNMIQLQSPNKVLASKLTVLKQRLTRISGIDNVTICSGNPISGNSIIRYELENDAFYTPYIFSGDEDFVKTLALKVVEGEFIGPGKEGKLVNEAFVRFFNFSRPIGEIIPGTKDKIIGVVKDFTCVSFKNKIPPVIISFNQNASQMLISYRNMEISSMLPLLRKEWNTVFPDYLFSYKVIQQELLNKYKEESFIYEIIVVSAIVSMVISCFGLFALSWAVVQARVKEMGIRKVLGASTWDILHLLTISFIKRIVIAFMLSAPLGYFLMNQWLDHFVNRIAIDFRIFLYSGCILALIAIVTLSFQTIKAAIVNPVDELRTE
jgi:putative ABC transport system permease protein